MLTSRAQALTEQGQITDRYIRAVDQLGSDKGLDVRIGGIYALERVARDSARDHPAVMELLTAFIREHSHEPRPPSNGGGLERERSTRPDVQAAITVVGRRDAKRDILPIDLTAAELPARPSPARTSPAPCGRQLNRLDGRQRFRPAEARGPVIRGNDPLPLMTDHSAGRTRRRPLPRHDLRRL